MPRAVQRGPLVNAVLVELWSYPGSDVLRGVPQISVRERDRSGGAARSPPVRRRGPPRPAAVSPPGEGCGADLARMGARARRLRDRKPRERGWILPESRWSVRIPRPARAGVLRCVSPGGRVSCDSTTPGLAS